MESPTSTYALSLSDASILDLDTHASSPVVVATHPEPEISAPPEYKGEPLFEPGDGDMQISVNGTRFETHKFLIRRLRGLRLLLDKEHSEINIQRNDVLAGDFYEMFKVLYASIITGPFEFTPTTLVSTLRVATIFEYQALRDYCIQHLETLELDAVKRIDMAREFRLPAWEGPAYHELGMRDEPITREEATIIGLDAFVCIAEIREKEQRRRGKEIDAMGGERDAKPSLTGEVTTKANTKGDGRKDAVSYAALQCTRPSTHETNNTMTRVVDSVSETGSILAGVELSGSYIWKSKIGYTVNIPGCECASTREDKREKRKCAVSPCGISVLKNIEARQSAQANRISDLQSSVKKLNDSIAASIPVSTNTSITKQEPLVEEHRNRVRPERPLSFTPRELLLGGKWTSTQSSV
ncbi:hypothetical protein B0J17DRAFT_639593 [Rhizoctonia solani]|nr:hypothetical protein B0J17DRAFT_639593 [Rhizoctonia solani]